MAGLAVRASYLIVRNPASYASELAISRVTRDREVKLEHPTGVIIAPIQSHNLKVAGSNPAPATKFTRQVKDLASVLILRLCFQSARGSTVEAPWKQEGVYS